MEKKFGTLFDTLKRRVNANLHETIFQNQDYLRLRWNRLTKALFWASNHPLLASLLIAQTGILFVFLFSLIQLGLDSSLLEKPKTLEHVQELSSLIFSAQVTILALIFPLVVAFIGILIQGKSSNKAIWHVYKQSSGFMLVGYSALTLILTFIGIAFAWSGINSAFQISIVSVLVIWFMLNILLTARFLLVTVKFLDDNERMEMIVRYSINEAIPQDLKNKLRIRLSSAVYFETLLPLYEKSNYSIDPFPIKGATSYKRKLKNKVVVNNIRYWILKWAIESWILSLPHNSRQKYSLHFARLGDGEALEVSLAETNGPAFSWITRLLFRLSYVFGKSEKYYPLNQMASALFSQLEDALKEDNQRAFKGSVDSVAEFEKEIELSMFFINSNKEPDNWILLNDSEWYGYSYLDYLLEDAREINKIVISKISNNQYYYGVWCYFYLKLFRLSSEKETLRVGMKYMEGHYLLWVDLMRLLSGYKGFSDYDLDISVKRFVGSWESWRSYLNKIVEGDGFSKNYAYLTGHLEKTGKMVVHATTSRNWKSAVWAVDMVLNWSNNFDVEEHLNSHRYYSWFSELVTLNLIESNDGYDFKNIVFSNEDYDVNLAKSIALENRWLDIRLMTASFLISSFSYSTEDSIKDYVERLINCKRLEDGRSSGVTGRSINSPTELLNFYFRLLISETPISLQDNTWNELYLEALNSISEPAWVSGRVYTSVGTKVELYMPVFLKVVGVGLSTNRFHLDSRFQDFFESNMLSLDELNYVIRHLSKLIEIDQDDVIKAKKQFDLDEAQFENQKNNFVDSILAILEELKQQAKLRKKVEEIYLRVCEKYDQ